LTLVTESAGWCDLNLLRELRRVGDDLRDFQF